MAPAILLDRTNGSLRIEGGPLISPSLSKDDAVRQLSAFLRGRRNMNNGYEWLDFHNVSFGGQPAYFSLCFYGQRLDCVNWNVGLQNEDPDEEVNFVRGVLRQILQRSFNSGKESFPWGGIWADIDHKTQDASFGLRYAAYETSLWTARRMSLFFLFFFPLFFLVLWIWASWHGERLQFHLRWSDLFKVDAPPVTDRTSSHVIPSTPAADLGSMPGKIGPPPPPPGAGADPPSPRVPKGRVPKVLKRVEPIYPPLAREARIEGVVVFRVDVGMDGHPEGLHLISGHPLLVPYASDAIQQWEFEKPAAPVSTQVELRFALE